MPVLTPDERRRLLAVARAALHAHVTGGVPALAAAAAVPCSVFVTLRLARALRGCIGLLEQERPLADLVARCAVAAATEDPRFPPVAPSELPAIDIEISVLGPCDAIDGPADVEIGRHGLLVEDERRCGLLLPQVAIEWGWDREAFVAHVCLKAGLPPDAWRNGARLYRFEAEVFAEAGVRPGSDGGLTRV